MIASTLVRETSVGFGKDACRWLALRYHAAERAVLDAAEELAPEQFLRLFVTAHGMKPVGTWQTHTYARVRDSRTGRDHFFLIPIPRSLAGPDIRIRDGRLWVDDIPTPARPQSIPHTTPFWYFHYDPNLEETRPFHSMTLNLKPACPEKCVLCAGAKTGRVNNGLEGALETENVMERIFAKYPQAREQLDTVAVVTGCFPDFAALTDHLKEVRQATQRRARPGTYRVLEHNVTTPAEFDVVAGELGYEVFVTLECFDQKLRDIALNGRVGRKGRDSREFLELLRVYADYLEARPALGQRLIRVTYLMGLDSPETTDYFFRRLAQINAGKRNVTVLPWVSVFTPYDEPMRRIQQPGFGLKSLLDAQALCARYFDAGLLAEESGGTGQGYARGLF